MSRSSSAVVRWFAVLLTLLVATGAFAQVQSGNIFGTVVSNDGSGLPGVTVTLSGVGAGQTTVTDGQGKFRFINLSPAQYTLKAELSGYGTATRSGVTVNIGRNAEIEMRLNPSVSETITVTAEAPLLDTRRTGTGATVTEIELEEVPTARDPWVILQQVPGVLMDRINVGGNESGNQSQFVSKGASGFQATYSVDGVNTTDMIATGSSSDYFDFGSFEEIQVATGGTDPRVATPGAQINIVTKRGTNDFSGSGRYYIADGEWQASGAPDAEAASYLLFGNEIDQNSEMGIDFGGPIIRDRLWGWGAYADQKIDLFVAQPVGQTVRYADKTRLKTLNAKINAQVMSNNSATFFYSDNSKTKEGRNASPTRPPETTWNQAGFGPKGVYKLEDTHIFSSNFYLTGMYSKVNGGFSLYADGCKDIECVQEKGSGGSWVLDLTNNVNRNTFLSVQGERPQEQYRADGSAFFNTGAMSHELKFGFGYRTAGAEGLTVYPNNQIILDFGGGPGGLGITYFYAIGPYNYEYQYNDLYVGDTMLFGNLTVQAGLRWDSQNAEAGDQVGPASSILPEYMPAVSVAGGDISTMEWTSIAPRLGLTYALGEEKRTLLRAAYNRYVDQLGSSTSGFSTVIPGNYRYIGFYTIDANADDIITRNEILFDDGIYGTPFGFDPDNPSSPISTSRVDPDIEAPTTDEYIIGFEHELVRDLVIGANFTHRDFDKFVGTRREKHAGAGDFYTRADYVQVGTVSTIPGQTIADPYSVAVYDVPGGVSPFRVLTNLPDYSQTYDGLELSLVKRMANRWMFRGNLSWSDWSQQVGDEFVVNPTPLRTAGGCSICDGAAVVQGSGTISGAKGGVWINSTWAVNAAAVYQIPVIETNLGANFTMREGYPLLFIHESDTDSGRVQVLVNDVDAHRLPNPYSLDLRLSKDFRFSGIGLELSVDAFNVTNEKTILQRNTDLARNAGTRPAANRIREQQSPRIFRLGARFTF